MQKIQGCFLLFFAVITVNLNISVTAASMSSSSQLKVATGTAVSGAIGCGLSALLAYACNWEKIYHRDLKSGLLTSHWQFEKTKSMIICSIATVASSLIGGYISYCYFTPEGQVNSAGKTVKSVDIELLHLINTSTDYDQFYDKIKFFFKKSSFPTIVVFEYLDKKRSGLLWAKEILEQLLKKIAEYQHLEYEIVDLLDSINTMMPMIEKGIDIIRSDPSFDAKWEAHMLEKRLHAMEQELSSIRWQMISNNLCNNLRQPSTTSTYHYHYID